MGLDIYLNHKEIGVEQKEQYTGFVSTGKKGYIRSSYNDWGLSHWLEANFGTTLYDALPDDEKTKHDDDGYIHDWDRKKFLDWALSLQKKAKKMKESFIYMQHEVSSSLVDVTSIDEKFKGKKRKFGGITYGKEGVTILETRIVKGYFGPALETKVKLSKEDHKDYLKQVENLVNFGKLAVKRNASVYISG